MSCRLLRSSTRRNRSRANPQLGFDQTICLDATPSDDSAFPTPGGQGEQPRMDLLTCLAHEVGHLLGQEHAEDGVMIDTLATGIRPLPGSTEVNDWSALLDVLVAEPLGKRRR